MEEDKGNTIKSSERIVNYTNYEKIEENDYTKEDVKKAKFIRGAKREAIAYFAPKEGVVETPEEIKIRIKNEQKMIAKMKKAIEETESEIAEEKKKTK